MTTVFMSEKDKCIRTIEKGGSLETVINTINKKIRNEGDIPAHIEKIRVFCLPKDKERPKIKVGVYVEFSEKHWSRGTSKWCMIADRYDDCSLAHDRYNELINKIREGKYKLVLNYGGGSFMDFL